LVVSFSIRPPPGPACRLRSHRAGGKYIQEERLLKRKYFFAAISLLVGTLISLPAGAAQSAKQAEPSSDDLPVAYRKWKGDLDGMVKRRAIRALVVNSKTFYFLDMGRQYGVSYEGLKAFETGLNKKLKTKDRKVQVYFIPVSRDEIIPALLDGRGDIAAANLTVTPERQKRVDFSTPRSTAM